MLPFFSKAQNDQLKFQRIDYTKGLSQNNVTAIYQDHRGLIWMGTGDGLNRYDGYRIKVFRNNTNDIASISNNVIIAITGDRNNNLWIATSNGGLNKYDPLTNQFKSFKATSKYKKGLTDNHINALMIDRYNQLWIGTEMQGVFIMDLKSETIRHLDLPIDKKLVATKTSVESIIEDADHCIWIGTYGQGVVRYNPKSQAYQHFNKNTVGKNALSSNFIYQIFQDSKKRIWFATDGGGLNLWLGADRGFKSYQKSFSDFAIPFENYLYCVNEDRYGNIWVGSEDKGLFIFNPENNHLQHYINNNADQYSLGDDGIYSILRDTKGNMWLGTYSAGVSLFNEDLNKFTHYRHQGNEKGLVHNTVMSMMTARSGKIWIGTDGKGINIFDPLTKKFELIQHRRNDNTSISSNSILTTYEDREGNIWVGSWGGGLSKLDPKTMRCKQYNSKGPERKRLESDNVWCVFEDKEGIIWAGTHGGGLSRLNPLTGQITNYTSTIHDPQSISNDLVHDIKEDQQGRLWIATQGGGINIFDKKTQTFTPIRSSKESHSLKSDFVNSIYFDNRGNAWVSTSEGLSQMDLKTRKCINYTSNDGLPNNHIYGIIEDAQQYLWISTNMGISKMNIVKKKFVNYEDADGLQSHEFKDQSLCKGLDGAIYFGGINGFNQFYPSAIKTMAYDPPIILTSFQIFNKEVPIAIDDLDDAPLKKSIIATDTLNIPYSSSVISIEFASLNYTSTEKKQYRYILENYDKEWNNIGNEHKATYTKLDPGHYIFKVQGVNNEGNFSRTTRVLHINVIPPFWMTAWFRTLIIMIMAGLIIATIMIRARKRRKEMIALERKVIERTTALSIAISEEKKARHAAEQANKAKSIFLATMSHEIRTPMNGIIGMSALMSQTELSEEQRKFNDTIQISSDALLNVINDVLDFSKIESGKLDLDQDIFFLRSCLEEVVDLFSARAKSAGIALNLRVEEDVPDAIMGDKNRLKQVLMNLVSNAIKFTIEGSVLVHVYANVQSDSGKVTLHFNVSDTGIGIHEEKIKKLFVAFTQVDDSASRKFGGSGLGLVICKKLLELMGGEIVVKSTPGKGSTFSFSFTTTFDDSIKKKTQSNLKTIEQIAQDTPLLILLAEDNPINQELAIMVLKKLGYTPDVVANGYKAIEAVQKRPYDLVLMDVQMPEMDGITATEAIRKLDLQQPVIIAMTANAMEGDRNDCMAAGMNDYLSKPAKPSEMAAILLKWAEHIREQKQ